MEGITVREPDIRGSTPMLSSKLPSNAQPRSISQIPSSRDAFISKHPAISSLQGNVAQTSSPKLAPRSSKSSRTHDNREVIVVSDSDSDTPPPSQPSKLAKFSTLGPRLPVALSGPSSATTERSISHPKVGHPPAREEEESSDSTKDQQYHPQSIFFRSSSSDQPLQSTAYHANANKAIALTSPSQPRNEQNVIGSSQPGISPIHSSSQKENERKREVYKQQVTQNEKRRRHEHKQRQQELLRAKGEGEEPQLERVTTHVVDLTLDTSEKPVHIQDIASQSSKTKAINLETDIHASPTLISITRSTIEKRHQKETALDLFPQWIHARKSSRDTWDRSIQKKSCAAPPSQSRRKFRAQKLEDAQPRVYHFDSTDWVNRMKRGPR